MQFFDLQAEVDDDSEDEEEDEDKEFAGKSLCFVQSQTHVSIVRIAFLDDSAISTNEPVLLPRRHPSPQESAEELQKLADSVIEHYVARKVSDRTDPTCQGFIYQVVVPVRFQFVVEGIY